MDPRSGEGGPKRRSFADAAALLPVVVPPPGSAAARPVPEAAEPPRDLPPPSGPQPIPLPPAFPVCVHGPAIPDTPPAPANAPPSGYGPEAPDLLVPVFAEAVPVAPIVPFQQAGRSWWRARLLAALALALAAGLFAVWYGKGMPQPAGRLAPGTSLLEDFASPSALGGTQVLPSVQPPAEPAPGLASPGADAVMPVTPGVAPASEHQQPAPPPGPMESDVRVPGPSDTAAPLGRAVPETLAPALPAPPPMAAVNAGAGAPVVQASSPPTSQTGHYARITLHPAPVSRLNEAEAARIVAVLQGLTPRLDIRSLRRTPSLLTVDYFHAEDAAAAQALADLLREFSPDIRLRGPLHPQAMPPGGAFEVWLPGRL